MARSAYILLSSMKKIRNSKNRTGPGSEKQALNDDELWRAFSSKIKPMNARAKNLNLSSFEKSYYKPQSPQNSTNPHRRTLPKSTARVLESTPFEHGTGDGLDRSSRKKMRRGKVEVEARLDLHGMIQTQAHQSLFEFLQRAHTSGRKSVLVITGKGFSQTGEIGVLRRAVPKWLNELPLRNWIRGFDHASPADGGEGALYILLRRKR